MEKKWDTVIPADWKILFISGIYICPAGHEWVKPITFQYSMLSSEEPSTYVILTLRTLYFNTKRSLIEKLVFAQLVKIFPALYGSRKFVAVFTTARHLSLS